MLKIVNENNFDKEIESGVVVVDFFAEWCGPCKMLSPILEEIQSELMDQVKIIKVNVDENLSLISQYNITNIPALVILKDGNEVDRLVGFLPKQIIKENIEKSL